MAIVGQHKLTNTSGEAERGAVQSMAIRFRDKNGRALMMQIGNPDGLEGQRPADMPAQGNALGLARQQIPAL